MNCSGDRDGFKQEMTEKLDMYGFPIDHYNVNGTYVGVYVDTQSWDLSPEDLRKNFITEICFFAKHAAENNKISSVTVTIFTTDREQICNYTIEGK